MAGERATIDENVRTTTSVVVVEPRTLMRDGLVAGLRSLGIDVVGVASLDDVAVDPTKLLSLVVDGARIGLTPEALRHQLDAVTPDARILILHDTGSAVTTDPLVSFIDRSTGVDGIARALAMPHAVGGTTESLAQPPQVVLSGIERSIMCHISNGATARETAAALQISHRTVENHKRRIFTRLGAATQAQAVALAIRAGELTALERAS